MKTVALSQQGACLRRCFVPYVSYIRKAEYLWPRRGNQATFAHKNNAVRYELQTNGIRGGQMCLKYCLEALFRQRLAFDAVPSLTCRIFVRKRPYARKGAVIHCFAPSFTRDPKRQTVKFQIHCMVVQITLVLLEFSGENKCLL